MTPTERLKAARGGLNLAKSSLEAIRQQARQAVRDRVRAEASFQAAERRQQDLAPAREEMERQRRASDFLNVALEEAEELVFLTECSIADTLHELEAAAIFGPELLLPIWD